MKVAQPFRLDVSPSLSVSLTADRIRTWLLQDEAWPHLLLILAFAVALRLPYLGDPAIYIDEQFYYVVADQ